MNCEDKRQRRLIWLCWLVYTVAYLGRYSYNSNISRIIEAVGASKQSAGLVTTCFFFAYGVGQIVNGLLCRRYPKRAVLTAALLVSSALNFAVWLGVPFSLYAPLWLFNGVVQSVLWSSLLLILGDHLRGAYVRRAVIIMSTSVAVGTAVTYGFSALFSLFGSYRLSFLLGGGVMLAVAALWFGFYPRLTRGGVAALTVEPTAAPTAASSVDSTAASSAASAVDSTAASSSASAVDSTAASSAASTVAPSAAPTVEPSAVPTKAPSSAPTGAPTAPSRRSVGAAALWLVALLGMFAVADNLVKDGLTTWVPQILKETFGLSDGLSILLTLCLPVLAVFGTAFAVALNRRIRDYVLLSGVLFFLSAACIGGVMAGIDRSFLLVLILFSLVSLLMAGVNNIVTSMAPLTLRDRMNPGLLAGILNGCCYVGSTVSSYALGALADGYGWGAVFRLLFAVCCLPVAMALIYGAVAKLLQRRT